MLTLRPLGSAAQPQSPRGIHLDTENSMSKIRSELVDLLTEQRSSRQSLKEIDLMRKIELLNNDEVICCSYRQRYHE